MQQEEPSISHSPFPPPTQCGRGTSAELDFGCRILGSFGVVLIGGGGVRIRIGPLHSDKVSAIIMVSIIYMIYVVDTHLMSTNDTCSTNVYRECIYLRLEIPWVCLVL